MLVFNPLKKSDLFHEKPEKQSSEAIDFKTKSVEPAEANSVSSERETPYTLKDSEDYRGHSPKSAGRVC